MLPSQCPHLAKSNCMSINDFFLLVMPNHSPSVKIHVKRLRRYCELTEAYAEFFSGRSDVDVARSETSPPPTNSNTATDVPMDQNSAPPQGNSFPSSHAAASFGDSFPAPSSADIEHTLPDPYATFVPFSDDMYNSASPWPFMISQYSSIGNALGHGTN